MIIRRKANKIDRLKNRLGDWLNSEQHVINHIQDGFQEPYKSQHLSSIAHSDFDVDWATTLSDGDSRMLSTNISSLEIRKALFSLKPFKAPGEDGLHAGFFHHFWPTLRSSVTEEVQNIFVSKKMPAYLN